MPCRNLSKFNKGLFYFAAMMLSILLVASPSHAQSGATGAVKAVLDKAMDIQTRPDLEGPEHRKERATQTRKLIAESFASAEMARDSLHGHWEKLSAPQRQQFQELFTGLFQDSYTRMVLNFLGRENVEYPGEDAQGKETKVKTVIMRTNEHIPVDYTVEQKGPKWLIRDVVIDGVSIVDNYKTRFSQVISTKGFDSLMQTMRTQRKAAEEN